MGDHTCVMCDPYSYLVGPLPAVVHAAHALPRPLAQKQPPQLTLSLEQVILGVGGGQGQGEVL